MTNSKHPSPPPTLTLVEKLYAVHNINSLIPEKLDLAESNYSTWSYFFKRHCSNFGVLKHIEEPVTEASTSTPPMDEWITADSIDAIETIFQDKKRTCTISLKGELRVIQKGDQTADEYFSKIEAILTLLTDLGSDMSDDDVVTYAINGLEELRLRSRSSVLRTGTISSAPQVLLAEASSRNQTGWNNHERDNRTTIRTPRNSNNSTTHRTTQETLPMHAGSQSGQSQPTASPGFQSGQQPTQQAFSPQQQALLLGTVQGSTIANGQATLLHQAFNTMTLRDPTDAN
ncbi:hypothetical protein Tco_1057376 [Tanacetum coccineum]|uniref:Retrotransposon gag domain-containing protein n=1 Tax=Tanacetum coccineum TaxID=301880 RepID=A0ABQ5H5F2_9ASTR